MPEPPTSPEALRTQPSAGVLGPTRAPHQGLRPRRGQAFWSRCLDRSQLHRPEAGLAPGGLQSLERLGPVLGLQVTGPPTPCQAPHGPVSTGHSPRASISGPTATGRPLNSSPPSGPHTYRTAEPQDQGETPGRSASPLQGQPHPQLRSTAEALSCLQASVGPRGPDSRHSSWVTQVHTKPLLPRSPGRFGSGRPK